jgi:hypothetical protein
MTILSLGEELLFSMNALADVKGTRVERALRARWMNARRSARSTPVIEPLRCDVASSGVVPLRFSKKVQSVASNLIPPRLMANKRRWKFD